MRRSLPCLLLVLLVACPRGESDGTYYDANAELGEPTEPDAQEPAHSRAPAGRPTSDGELAFESILVAPERVTVLDEITADAKLRAGASSFADVEYTWYVNDREVLGVQRPTLDPETGRFRRGDRIEVEAAAIDERGQTARLRSQPLTVANASPRIIDSSAANRVGIDGLVLRAEDPDGDAISWSVLSGPPGVEIDQSGRIRVRQTDIAAAFDGEVVLAASDGHGARSEWHVPVSVNAARDEVKAERTTTTERTRLDMDDEEYERVNLESLDRVMGMSDEDFERYTRQQEDREAEMLRQERERRRRK